MRMHLIVAAVAAVGLLGMDHATYAQRSDDDHGKSVTGRAAGKKPAEPVRREKVDTPSTSSSDSSDRPSAGSKEESPGVDSSTSNSH